jgi:nucleotide-binding universal stress UspA family protein
VHIAKVRPATTGTELARKAIERAREEGGAGRSALGAGSIAASVGSQMKSVASAQQLKAQQHVAAPAVHAGGKCRVLTASYGGSRSVIIRHVAEHQMNYVVLGINESDRVREIDAFLSAYAPGGESIGEYAGRDAALDEAFRLCPES